MRRRELITLLGGAAAWPIAARAQQPGKLLTIGFLVPGTPSSHGQWVAAFVQRLRELGWIEGHNLTSEYRWAEGRSERFTEIAAEFVQRKVDAIVHLPARHLLAETSDDVSARRPSKRRRPAGGRDRPARDPEAFNFGENNPDRTIRSAPIQRISSTPSWPRRKLPVRRI